MRNIFSKKTIFVILLGLVLVLNISVLYANQNPESEVVQESFTEKSNDDSKSASSKTIVEKNVNKNTDDVNNAVTKKADFIYEYYPNQIYTIYCNIERIVDVQLQPGEEIITVLGADSLRWMVDKDVSGSGNSKRWHLFIKPQKPDVSTNIVITTDRRVYHLLLFSRDYCTPIVNWSYPYDERLVLLRNEKQQEKIINDSIPLGKTEESEEELTLEKLNFKYRISGKSYPWKPVLVFDDGSKTYIKMPATMASSEAPSLFIKNGKKLSLVNYRVKNGYFIVDRLGDVFQLNVGKEKIKITKLN